MPRNSGGDYSLPAGNPVVTGTAISSTWANTTLDDLADAMTDSLSRTGDGGMLAPLELDSGTVGAPGLAFSAETSLGLYRVGAARLGIAVGGSKIVEVDAAGLEVTGTLTPSGVVVGSLGTAALPGYSFTGDLNTGMSAEVADTLVLSTGGTARLTLTSALATFAPVIGAPAGTAALPGISFSGDLNTGLSAQTADTLIASVAGAAALTLTATQASFASPIIAAQGDATAPGVAFAGTGTNDGMYLVSNNNLGFATNGTLRLTVNADITAVGQYFTAGGSASSPAYSITGDTNTGIYSDLADELFFSLGGTGYRIGFRNLPNNQQNADYTCVLTDSGKMIRKSSGGSGETFTIPANASVAYELGTVLTFINVGGGTVTIAITTDTLTWAVDGSTGSRTLADNGIATAIKVNTTEWLISGTGLS